MFVLGPNLQFRSNGESIPQGEQMNVWVDYLLKKLKIINQIHPLNDLPFVRRPSHTAVKGIKKLSGQNALSAVHVLGKITYYHKTVMPITGYIEGPSSKYTVYTLLSIFTHASIGTCRKYEECT